MFNGSVHGFGSGGHSGVAAARAGTLGQGVGRFPPGGPAPSFDAVMHGLDGLDTASGRPGAMTANERAYEAAQSLVSTALVQPMLQLARRDPFRSELFHGGQAEDAFGAQLDQQIADRVVHSMPLGIVDAIYRQVSGAGGGDLEAGV